jgi:hypothetical protein
LSCPAVKTLYKLTKWLLLTCAYTKPWKMNILEYARKPYPLRLSHWGIIIAISLFVSIFMVVFQPFGLQAMDSDRKSLLLTGYGLVTFVVLFVDMIILPLVFHGVFREERWTVFKQVIWLVWIVITIAFGNYVYSDLLSIVHWIGIKGYLYFIGFTFSIAVIPIIGVTFISYNQQLKRNLRDSQQLNKLIEDHKAEALSDDIKLVITSENKKQKIEIPSSNLICIESEGNYVNTWFLEEGKIIRSMVRITLKNIESQIGKSGSFFKCHRAYIVNLSHIEKVKGNSQGYRLIIKYLEKEIPVSRNYSKSFREAFRSKS